MKMTAKVRASWIGKLRSGEVEQCRHMLRNGDRRCCLGVLSDILPEVLGGYPTNMTITDQLVMMRMNDDDGLTFVEIADYLEANPGLCPAGGSNDR